MYHRITEDGKILTAARKFMALSISFLGILILLRMYEILSVCTISSFPSGSWKSELLGLRFDIALAVRLLSIFMIPYLIIAYFSQKASKYFFMACNMLVAFASLSLEKYFTKSLVPLGADLWGYSATEIKQTVGSSGALGIGTIIPYLAFASFAVWFSLFIFKFEFKRTYSLLFCLTLFFLLFVNLPMRPKSKKNKSEFARFAENNKLGFFLLNNLDFYQKKLLRDRELKEMEANSVMPSSSDTSNLKPLDKEYPFLHQDQTRDVLGQFFNTKKQLPNLVFIVVESLGRSYSGKDAELGSFTPYLDSLMEKSLYWENFLSTSGRTFSVMPSLFGSLPFGENGFAELGKDMPNQLSLISLLIKNGYKTGFYYGSDAKFDNMELFFKKQGMKNIVDQHSFEASYPLLPASKSGFTWGYGDRDLFKKYLSMQENADPNQPRLDILLTIDMHDPFLLAPQIEYNSKVEAYIRTLQIPDEKKKYDAQYIAQYASVMYFDDALKYFIQEFSKREDYNNTIFIITGDHRMPEIPISSQLDRFHVPLVIFSPMLKRPQKISSISSHFDVTPSILALLRANYQLNLPTLVSWLGTGLDVQPKFRSIHAYPMMRNKSEMVDFVDHEYFISTNTLYKIYQNAGINEISDPKKLKELQDKFEVYKRNNWYVCKKNKIMPDSILTNYK